MGLGVRALAAVAALWLGGGAASAQMSAEEEQRCVWQCLYNSPGAESREYQDCVASICLAGEPAEPPAAAPSARWAAGAGSGGSHFAGVEIPGRSFSFLCQRGGPGLLAVAGMGTRSDGIAVRIDQQAYGLPFVAENGMLYTAAEPPLLRALMAGNVVQVTVGGDAAAFPLAGSAAAIRAALAGCGLAG